MAAQEHVDLLKQGVGVWNAWRREHPQTPPDLVGADFSDATLQGANFWGANLSSATFFRSDLSGATFCRADLSGADLTFATLEDADLRGVKATKAVLSGADLTFANLESTDLRGAVFRAASWFSSSPFKETELRGAILAGAFLRGANLTEVDLSGANLRRATLTGAQLVRVNLTKANLREAHLQGAILNEALLIKTNLQGADLSGCSIHGVSVWNAHLEGADQSNLVITGADEPVITVDSLEVAQFIYLILNNTKIRQVIDTITSKVVLILGRFTHERKPILDALRNALRQHNYSPVLFDFEKPASRDLTETVSILAHLSRFIIVDLTDPSSAPHEVATVIPYTQVPVQPLLLREPLIVDGNVRERREYAMFEDLRHRYHWVLPTFRYQNIDELLNSLQAQIIAPAEEKARELTQTR